MKILLRIFPLIFIYLLLSSKSCDDNGQHERELEKSGAGKSIDSITAVFETQNPDQTTIKAFEAVAILKLSDLSDYLRILGDSSTDKAFKVKAGEMAAALILPGLKLPVEMSGAYFDSARIVSGLKRDCDTFYSGQLAVRIHFHDSVKFKKGFRQGSNSIIDIFTVKQKKVFGRDTLRIWRVFLGGIR